MSERYGVGVRDKRQHDALPKVVKTALARKAEDLSLDPFGEGERIQRALWPKPFRLFPNLFRLALPQGRRALYTIRAAPDEDVKGVVEIVWIGTHKEYDRLFGY